MLRFLLLWFAFMALGFGFLIGGSAYFHAPLDQDLVSAVPFGTMLLSLVCCLFSGATG